LRPQRRRDQCQQCDPLHPPQYIPPHRRWRPERKPRCEIVAKSLDTKLLSTPPTASHNQRCRPRGVPEYDRLTQSRWCAISLVFPFHIRYVAHDLPWRQPREENAASSREPSTNHQVVPFRRKAVG
jgi:hypothetical protein